MMRAGKAAVVLAAASVVTGAAAARAGKCARADEVSAIQTAAIQQELMVAALTCNEIARFNAFQTGFGPELRASDATLARMFRRLYGARRGEAEYHAFKTRLANNSSMRSIHDNPAYCREAASILSSALVVQKPTLAEFAASVPVAEHGPVDACELRVGATLAKAAASPAPRHKRHRNRTAR